MFLCKGKWVALVVLAIGVAGSGLGFRAHRPNAAAPAQPNQPAQNNGEAALRDKLSQEIDYGGLEDARATLSDALDQLSKRYNLNFHANRHVFLAIDPKIDVFAFAIADPFPLPPMRASLGTVLRTILQRLPPKMGAMYLIRKEFIEITTEAAVRAELGIPANRPLLPLVCDTLDDVPITAALRQLADKTGYNIVIDPRIADKLRASTNLIEFNNVPVDTAARLLANMAGLSVVRLDNVLYVTTADNAKHLREQQAQANADKPTASTEAPKKPTK
jgi:hypothetical protein